MSLKSSTLTSAIIIAGLGMAYAAKPAQGNKGGDYNADEIVKTFDKNADGKLSLEEFSAMKKFAKEANPKDAAKKLFDEDDTNKDGFVTAEELKAAHDKKMAAGKSAPKDGGKKPEAAKPESPKTDAPK